MHRTRIGQPFFVIMSLFLCVSLLLGLALHAVFDISPAVMMAVVLMTPIILYIIMMGMLTIGLLIRTRWQPSPPHLHSSFRTQPPGPPNGDGDSGLSGVREPRRPLPPPRGAQATVLRDDE